MPTLNKTLLRKVRNKILKTPESYNQLTYGMSSGEAPCGAVCCILGWADVLAGNTPLEHVSKKGYRTDVFERARKSLGLTDSQAEIVADGSAYYWPDKFSDKYRKAKTDTEKARAAADYLNYIIRTGKVR